jgi:hypothetical protein
LEELSRAFADPVAKAMEKVCRTCNKHLKDPYENSDNK